MLTEDFEAKADNDMWIFLISYYAYCIWTVIKNDFSMKFSSYLSILFYSLSRLINQRICEWDSGALMKGYNWVIIWKCWRWGKVYGIDQGLVTFFWKSLFRKYTWCRLQGQDNESQGKFEKYVTQIKRNLKTMRWILVP